MIKSVLVQRVADKNVHLHRRDIEKVVTTVLEKISAALVRRNRVELRGFGSFTVKVRSARPGRNPKTGSLVSVPETVHAALDGTGNATSSQCGFTSVTGVIIPSASETRVEQD
jgi:integration host factor subunit beta